MKGNAKEIGKMKDVLVQAVLEGSFKDSETAGYYFTVAFNLKMGFPEWIEKAGPGGYEMLSQEQKLKALEYHEYCAILEVDLVSMLNEGYNFSGGAIFVAKKQAFRLVNVNTIVNKYLDRALVQIHFEPTTI